MTTLEHCEQNMKVIEIGVPGLQGETGAKVVSTELIGQDEQGGNIYEQTFDDGNTAQFTAPKGATGDVTPEATQAKEDAEAAARLATEKAETVTQKYDLIAPHFDAIDGVHENRANVNTVADDIENVNSVAENINDIKDVKANAENIDTCAENIDDIKDAKENADNAAESARAAAESASAYEEATVQEIEDLFED